MYLLKKLLNVYYVLNFMIKKMGREILRYRILRSQNNDIDIINFIINFFLSILVDQIILNVLLKFLFDYLKRYIEILKIGLKKLRKFSEINIC